MAISVTDAWLDHSPDFLNSTLARQRPRMDSVEPKLPQELERRVFLLAYYTVGSPDNKLLLLVAKRTRHWLRPLLYRVFYQCSTPNASNPFPKLQDRPSFVNLHEICEHVKSLAIDDADCTVEQAGAFIEQCHNVENLACWGNNRIDVLSSSIQKLPSLRRLSSHMSKDITPEGRIAPSFSTVTHLELLYMITDLPTNILASFPQLTHLILHIEGYIHHHPVSNVIALQSSCPRLRVFVGCTVFIHSLPPDYVELYANNQRMVFIGYGIAARDWLNGARGERDIWWLAETVVIARRSECRIASGPFGNGNSTDEQVCVPSDNYFKSNDYQKKPLSVQCSLFDHLTEEGKHWYLSL